MNTSIKLLASAFVAFAVTFSSPAYSIDDHSAKKAFTSTIYPNADASKIWMVLAKYQSAEKVTLELISAKGKVLFREIALGKNAKNMSYRQAFDISELTDGQYTFRITAGDQQEEHSFNLATPSVEITNPSRLVAIK